MNGARATITTIAIAGLMMALIAGLAFTGKSPGGQMLQRFAPRGIIAASPVDVLRVEMRLGKERLALHRTPTGSWAFDGVTAQTVPDEVASHLETALRFLHVSAATRTLEVGNYTNSSIADFGLEQPSLAISLGAADGSVTTVDFGALNPATTSQYARLAGHPTLYMLPRHVGNEWQLAANLAERGRPAASGGALRLLLPASMDQVWAVEIVFAGKLHRFERDGAARWFLHVGQHTHDNATPAHVADPVKAPVIDAAFTAFGETEIERVVLQHPKRGERTRFGLERPVLIALLYPRDSSTPLARVEIGGIAEDGLGRFAQLSQEGDVLTIAPDELQRLIDLLRDVGANP